ncbi:MAG: hypothetical protein EOO75_15960 [Myxococcales bacterium]|nr:MAG: hypothetical protein EOO75_15960 [Myxococcales bacterium]
MSVSLDGGDTWKGAQTPNARVATDIPWLAWTEESYMTTSDLAFDPLQPDRIWFAQGIGFWSADLVGAPDQVTFTSQSRGIEQLVANQVISPPGGKPIAAAWDRPLFRIDDPDVFPATHGPDREQSIQMGWAVDWATSDPTFLVAVINWQSEKTGYSTDGGVTWQPFATHPPFFTSGKLRGGIAASSPQNIVWAPSDNGRPHSTQDGGQSWQECVFPGLPAGDESGFGWARWFNRHIVAADRVEPGTFYIYNYLKGVYRSQDGAASWQLVKEGELGSFTGYNARLRAVPGQAGHLFFTGGHQGGDPNDPVPAADIPLFRSTDGGTTWQPIAGTREIYDVSFGEPFAGGAYPSIYVVGTVNGVYGVHRSDDEGATWKQVGQWPLGSLDIVTGVTGDLNQAGRVYVSFGGSGFAYGDTAP